MSKNKDIPPLSTTRHRKGACPQEGWYPIEVCGQTILPCDPSDPARKLAAGEKHAELIRPETLQKLVDSYNPLCNGGHGLLINDCHLHLTSAASDRAKGFIKALAAEGANLWGYLSLTPEGARDINEGYYWATSTEYPYEKYQHVGTSADGTRLWEPTLLSGLALTNTPAHQQQAGLCINKKTPTPIHTNMPTDPTTPLEDDKRRKDDDATAINNKLEDDDATATNKKPEDDTTVTNIEGAPAVDWSSFADEVATILGAPADESGDALITRLKQLKADYDALSSAAPGTVTNCRPRFPRAVQHRHAIARNTQPSFAARVSLHIAGEKRQVDAKEHRMATHCQSSVDALALQLGRTLSPAEHSRSWDAAEINFENKEK